MVGSPEPDHLEGKDFLAVVGGGAKADGKVDAPEGSRALPGTMPWKGAASPRSLDRSISKSSRVLAYRILRLLPPSINTLESRVLPMMGSTTSGYCPGFGTWLG